MAYISLITYLTSLNNFEKTIDVKFTHQLVT